MALLQRGTLVLLVLAILGPVQARAASPPTVRLWATREGLVGRATASGHLITPNDHFVALPSRKALGQTVVVSYRGKSISAPVLDVGPWNRDDPWWESGPARGPFADLPRFVPEVWAAFEQGYNNGRDGTGRFVTFPAMIDIADGLYADLGMQQADWVDVTLNWIDAPSPPPLASADRKIVKKADPNPPAAAPPKQGAPPVPAPPVAHDERFFNETNFRIDNDAIWSYFRARGRVPAFGFPVSRTFVLLGCDVQVFQRQIAQACAGRGVTLMNVLDPEIFPYERVNGSALPAPDAGLKAETPVVGSSGYATEILEFVRESAPDSWESQSVGFGKTFFAMAATLGDNPLVNLEVWGAPISRPRRDPGNNNFVYQRFQRGIMHFDAATGRTQGLLLADYLKAIVRGRDLPADLAEAATGSKYFGQYCPDAARWVCRPSDLAATDLTFAFEQG